MKFSYLVFCICFLVLVACSPKMQPRTSGEMSITAMSPNAPLIKGIDQNPLMRLRVYVPVNSAAMQTKTIRVQLNKEATDAIEKLEVYSTGSEPQLSPKQPMASLTQLAQQMDIAVSENMKPGINYLWLTASLKPGVDMDHKISFAAASLTDGAGKNYAIDGVATTTKRIATAVRKPWDDSVHTYRIPGIITTGKGTLISVYDVRYKHSGDLPANVDVGMSRSTDGGKTWEPMKIVMDMGAPHENNGVGDPAALYDPVTKKIWVAALWSKGNRSIAGSEPGLSPDTTGQFVLVSSDDDGLTWSKPYSITPQVKDPKWHLYFNGPGNGIAMQNGTLVFPSQYWDESKKPGIPHSALIYSDDHGATWKSGIGAKSNTTEAQLVETRPGTIMLNMRDNRGRYRSVATTTDMGKTWTEHPTSYSALPDPVCMASFIKASVRVKGKLQDVLFFSNVASHTARENMTVQASLDMGETWQPAHKLLIDERNSFGYSALTRIDENTIGLLYEGVRSLYFIRIPVAEIIK